LGYSLLEIVVSIEQNARERVRIRLSDYWLDKLPELIERLTAAHFAASKRWPQ
jgi:hypothetical protein